MFWNCILHTSENSEQIGIKDKRSKIIPEIIKRGFL